MSFRIIDAHMHLGPSPNYLTMDLSMRALLDKMDRLGIDRASAHICARWMMNLRPAFWLIKRRTRQPGEEFSASFALAPNILRPHWT